MAVLAAGTIALIPFAPWLSCLGAWFLLRWRSSAVLPSLITWAGIGATWWLLRSLPELAWTLLPYAWAGLALAHVTWIVLQRLKTKMPRPWGVLASPPCCAMVIALLAPFALALHWSLAVPLAVGLWLTSSWLAILATLIALPVLFPVLTYFVYAWVVVLVAALILELRRRPAGAEGSTLVDRRVWDFMPRGRSLDGLRVRANVWRVIWAVWRHEGWWAWVKGRGPYTLNPAMQRWAYRYNVPLPEGDAFNDGLQHVHEYGLLGLTAIALFCWPVVIHLRLGDPWSAAWIVGAILSLGHWPMRWPTTGVVWLAVSARLA